MTGNLPNVNDYLKVDLAQLKNMMICFKIKLGIRF